MGIVFRGSEVDLLDSDVDFKILKRIGVVFHRVWYFLSATSRGRGLHFLGFTHGSVSFFRK